MTSTDKSLNRVAKIRGELGETNRVKMMINFIITTKQILRMEYVYSYLSKCFKKLCYENKGRCCI